MEVSWLGYVTSSNHGRSRDEINKNRAPALADLHTSSAANVGTDKDSATPSRASPNGLATASSMSSMMRRSPVRTPSKYARASRHSLTASRATACERSSLRMPAASRAN